MKKTEPEKNVKHMMISTVLGRKQSKVKVKVRRQALSIFSTQEKPFEDKVTSEQRPKGREGSSPPLAEGRGSR